MKVFNACVQMSLVLMLLSSHTLLAKSLAFSKVEKKEILWLMYKLPPYHIFERKDLKGKGVADEVFRRVKKALPEYRHKELHVSIPRMIEEMKKPSVLSCVTATFKIKEVAHLRQWTKAWYVEPPASIVTTKKVWQSLGKPNRIDLQSILEKEDLIFGRLKDRMYYGHVDGVLKHFEKRRNIEFVSSKLASETLLKLLRLKRIDWMISYPAEISWLFKSKALEGFDQIVSIPIKDYQVFQPVYSNCVKTKEGKAIVERLDSIITSKTRSQVHKFYEQWLLGEQSKRYFRQTQTDQLRPKFP